MIRVLCDPSSITGSLLAEMMVRQYVNEVRSLPARIILKTTHVPSCTRGQRDVVMPWPAFFYRFGKKIKKKNKDRKEGSHAKMWRMWKRRNPITNFRTTTALWRLLLWAWWRLGLKITKGVTSMIMLINRRFNTPICLKLLCQWLTLRQHQLP